MRTAEYYRELTRRPKPKNRKPPRPSWEMPPKQVVITEDPAYTGDLRQYVEALLPHDPPEEWEEIEQALLDGKDVALEPVGKRRKVYRLYPWDAPGHPRGGVYFHVPAGPYKG